MAPGHEGAVEEQERTDAEQEAARETGNEEHAPVNRAQGDGDAGDDTKDE